ncbi:MAG: winged helix-turn-helix domain-containing protein [Xanthobacteraceae bacterium]|nr:winged helix-turn-helix domain-containing protein [Xanthobacteraceae bacterium]
MAEAVKYGQTTFEADFLFGTNEQGSTVKFSRAERILLTKLTRSGRAILTRDDLLDALSGPGSDASDRNIDFVINRLRRKLGDSARNPTYIATQYGEGYVWVAERAKRSGNSAGAFLVVGPIRGMKFLGPYGEHARSYADELRLGLDRQTAKESKVVLDEDCPPAELFNGEKPRFAAELSFFESDNRLDCAITLKTFATGQIIRVSRHIVTSGEPPGEPLDRKAVESTAGEIVVAIWDALAYRASALATPSDAPLAVRMHDAALLLADTASWVETQKRLVSTLEKQPDDHRAQLMLATCIHSKYLMSGPMILPQQDFRKQDEDEIERLTLSSLPRLQDNPVFMMAAGKLLYFIGRSHQPLAIQIIEEAFNSTAAFATSFAILGQIRMFEGDIEAALALVDQGLELCPAGSPFELYLLVLKSQALLASDQRAALPAVLDTLFAKQAGLREALSIFYTSGSADEVPPEASHLLDNIDEARARAMLVWTNYLWARLFRVPEHRENYLRGPLTLLVGRLGPAVIPDEVRVSAPGLVAALVGKARLLDKS